MNLKITSSGYLKFSQEMKPSFSETASMEQELEKQLHEQYAINNNANLSSVIALLVSLFAAIGAYGYVFIHTTVTSLPISYPQVTSFDSSQFLFAAIGCLIVLAIMLHICMYQGFAQRYEQFVTYAIRYKYHSQVNYSMPTKKIFPDTYHPFNKSGLNIIQGLYGEIAKIIIFLLFPLWCISIVIKCHSNLNDILWLVFPIILVIGWFLGYYSDKLERYKKYEQEYSAYNPDKYSLNINVQIQ